MTLYTVSFFYTIDEVSGMVIYWDLVAVINFFFDFSLLLTVSFLLKRDSSYRKVFLGALVGELSMITLFVKFGDVEMFFFKILLNILMCLTTFSYKDIRYTFYNFVYLYLVGIILGGFEYYLYNEFQVEGGLGLKYLSIIFLSPLVLFVYYRLSLRFKTNYNNVHTLKILYGSHTFEGKGYLDSGNKLTSPINGKIIILVEKEYIIYHKLKLVPIPYNALNHHGLIYCFNPDAVYVDDRLYENLLIGLSEVKFNIEGCNVLLNARMENI